MEFDQAIIQRLREKLPDSAQWLTGTSSYIILKNILNSLNENNYTASKPELFNLVDRLAILAAEPDNTLSKYLAELHINPYTKIVLSSDYDADLPSNTLYKDSDL